MLRVRDIRTEQMYKKSYVPYKRNSKPKGQPTMDNPEKLAKLGTHDT